MTSLHCLAEDQNRSVAGPPRGEDQKLPTRSRSAAVSAQGLGEAWLPRRWGCACSCLQSAPGSRACSRSGPTLTLMVRMEGRSPVQQAV